MHPLAPFFQAIDNGDTEAVRQTLADKPGLAAERNPTDPRQGYALHTAARLADPTITQLLLSHGADPDALNADRTSPLGISAFYGTFEVARALLMDGARPDVRNDLGFTPIDAARAGERGAWKNYSSSDTNSWAAIVALLASPQSTV